MSGGSFTATIAARDALAIHTGATGPPSNSSPTGGTASGTVTVNFAETATTTFGEVRLSLTIYVANFTWH